MTSVSVALSESVFSTLRRDPEFIHSLARFRESPFHYSAEEVMEEAARAE